MNHCRKLQICSFFYTVIKRHGNFWKSYSALNFVNNSRITVHSLIRLIFTSWKKKSALLKSKRNGQMLLWNLIKDPECIARQWSTAYRTLLQHQLVSVGSGVCIGLKPSKWLRSWWRRVANGWITSTVISRRCTPRSVRSVVPLQLERKTCGSECHLQSYVESNHIARSNPKVTLSCSGKCSF